MPCSFKTIARWVPSKRSSVVLSPCLFHARPCADPALTTSGNGGAIGQSALRAHVQAQPLDASHLDPAAGEDGLRAGLDFG